MSETTSQTPDDLEAINDQERPLIASALNANYAGQIMLLEDSHAKSFLKITNEHISDAQGLAHSGFIYSAAAYLAQVVIKRENLFIIQSRVHYLAPIKVGDTVIFEAHSKLENTRRPESLIKAYVRDVCVFEGNFILLATDEHVLNMQQGELRRYQTSKNEA